MEYKDYEVVTMSLDRYNDLIFDCNSWSESTIYFCDLSNKQENTIEELRKQIDDLKQALLKMADKGREHYKWVGSEEQLLDPEIEFCYGLRNRELLLECGISEKELEYVIKQNAWIYKQEGESDESTTSEA